MTTKRPKFDFKNTPVTTLDNFTPIVETSSDLSVVTPKVSPISEPEKVAEAPVVEVEKSVAEPKPAVTNIEKPKFTPADFTIGEKIEEPLLEIETAEIEKKVVDAGGKIEGILSTQLQRQLENFATKYQTDSSVENHNALTRLKRSKVEELTLWLQQKEDDKNRDLIDSAATDLPAKPTIIKSSAEKSAKAGFSNGFENGNGKEIPRFKIGEKIVLVKPTGSFSRAVGSPPLTIDENMVGSEYTFSDNHAGLVTLESNNGQTIFVPESTLSSFKPSKEIYHNMVNGSWEKYRPIESILLPGENGSIEIASGQLWRFKTNSGEVENYDDFLIENISAAADGKLKIKFVDHEKVERPEEEWAGIFSVGELQPDKMEIVPDDNIASPKQVDGVVYKEGREIDEEKSNIPEVPTDESEIVEVEKQIADQVKAIVPEVKKEDQIETAGEAGESSIGEPDDVFVADGYEPIKKFVENGKDPNIASAKDSAALEAQRVEGQKVTEEETSNNTAG
ncbi:MAG: hypothetical protein NTY30_04945 [Candidatus Berkelbacteria bacterium]|nr:hypothetical protein [Candidatus Berkelbacteria bacterium]